jgi:hypothetical protein
MCALCLLFLSNVDLCHAQTVKSEVRLSNKPSGEGQGKQIAIGTTVKVIERQGFWVRIEVENQSGWVKASGLSFSSGSAGPTAIDTGRLGGGNIVSTSAARGLSAKDLLNGSPRIEEVAKMVQYVPETMAVQAFASQGQVIALAQKVSLKVVEPVAVKPAVVQTDSKPQPSNEKPKSNQKKASDDW